MITHTMLVAFEQPIPDETLDRFVADIRGALDETGVVRGFSAQRHIPVTGEEAIPAFIASAVLQFEVANEADLATLFAAPRVGDIIHTWQPRHPYKVAWVNHGVAE